MSLVFMANACRWALQVFLIVGGTALILRLLRADDPRLRLRVWHGVLLMSLLLPLVQPRLVAVPVLRVAVSSPSSPDLGSGPDWLFWTMLVVITGILLRALWLAVGLLKLRSLRRRSSPWQPLPDWWGTLVHEIGATANVGISREVPSAVTFGVRPASILVPQTLYDAPDSHQRAVLAHELTHVARRDWAWVLGEQAVRTVFWCHPAIWFALGEAQLAREEVVDRRAIAATGNRDGYLEALVAAAAPASAGALGFAPQFHRRRQLATRIRRLIKETPMSRTRLIAVASVLGLTVPATMLAAGHAFPLIAIEAATTIQQVPPPPPPPPPPVAPKAEPTPPPPPPPPPPQKPAKVIKKADTVGEPEMPPPPPKPLKVFNKEMKVGVSEMPPPPPPAPPKPAKIIKKADKFADPEMPPPPPPKAAKIIKKTGKGGEPEMPPPPPPPPAPAKIGRGGGR